MSNTETDSTVRASDLINEAEFSTARSSGPGGQNVNKVNSKVTLRFDIVHSLILTAEQKALLLDKLANQVTRDGVLLINSQQTRSQIENKALSIAKLDDVLIKAFRKIKPRKASKPGKVAKQKRLKSKKHNAEKKQWRQKPT